jgi:hypothetical protein
MNLDGVIDISLAAILKMADISKFWKRRIAPPMVTYHYVKFYVSIIIHLEVNVQNFNFPIGFYSNPQNLICGWIMMSRHWKISTGHHFENGHHNTAQIQHCPILTPFDMWVDNDVRNWLPTLKNFYRSPFSKWPPQYRKPLMVTYHYVKFYVSIIIHLEVININVRNFNFPIGFYSIPHCTVIEITTVVVIGTNCLNRCKLNDQTITTHLLIFHRIKSPIIVFVLFLIIIIWTPQNMTLTPFTTKLKTLGPTRNIYL